MTLDVEADAGALLRQAHTTADDYMTAAVDKIDHIFGRNYAKQHPELVAAFMTVAATNFATALRKAGDQDLRDGLHAIADAIKRR